ncbi:MAG: hypothetical protein H7242_07585 [Microbacteriaceae bacterium]|nr:hypothetical protein [Burkholderiaceae bacterium]
MLGAAGTSADTEVEVEVEVEVEGMMKFDQGAHAGQPHSELQAPAAMYLVLDQVGNAGLLAPLKERGLRAFRRTAGTGATSTAT